MIVNRLLAGSAATAYQTPHRVCKRGFAAEAVGALVLGRIALAFIRIGGEEAAKKHITSALRLWSTAAVITFGSAYFAWPALNQLDSEGEKIKEAVLKRLAKDS